MSFHNFTPFWPLQFEGCDERHNRFGVVVLKGSFALENGKRLRLLDQQEPLAMADKYFGNPEESSLHVENSLAPYKPKTDLVVIANAYSPTGKPEPKWSVSVEIGATKKQLTVTGPRQWVRRGKSNALSEIAPVGLVPIRYELAFGGHYTIEGKENFWTCNPVGVGFCDPASDELPGVPQILPFNSTELEFGQPVETVGLSSVASSWQPRLGKAGTFDLDWKNNRSPNLPKDFSFDFYNSASSGLVLPGFANGREMIRLVNLSPERELNFGLPEIDLATIMHFHDGRVVPGPVNLDTIHVDVEARRVFLHWRGIYPIHILMKTCEVQMSAPKSLFDAA